MNLLIIFILSLVSGYNLVNFFKKETTFLEKLCLGTLISWGILTYVNFLIFYFFGNFSFSILTPIVLSVLSFAVFYRKPENQKIILLPKVLIVKEKWKMILLISSVLLISTTIITSIYWPVRDWDALTLYDFRGKIIDKDQNLNILIESDADYYFSYPLYTSISHAIIYHFASNVSPMLLYSLTFLFFITLFFIILNDITDHTIALIFTTILMFSFDFSQHVYLSYTNLPYTVFLALGLFYLILYNSTQKLGNFYLSAILIGLSGWVRFSEPFWILSILLATLAIISNIKQNKNRWFLLILSYITIILFFRIPWQFFISSIDLKKGSETLPYLLNINFEYFYTLIVYMFKYFFNPYLSILSILTLSILLNVRKNKLYFLFPTLTALGLISFILAGVIALSLIYAKWEKVGGSLTRMAIFIIPMIIFYTALTVYNFRKNKDI